ncbi:MAG: O-antigen ligase family protein [Pseudomonadota bacterium]
MWRRFSQFLGLLGFGLLAGASAVNLGMKSIVLVPALTGMAVLFAIPNSAVYAIVATTPINVIIAGPLTVARVLIVLGFFVVFYQAFRRWIAFPRILYGPEGKLAFCFFIWIVIAKIGASGLSNPVSLGTFFIYAVLFYVLLNYVRNLAEFRSILILLAVVGALQAILVICEAKFGFSPFGGWQAELAESLDSSETRVVGTSSHPIILAGFFQVVLACAGMLLATTKEARMRVIYAAMMLLYIAGWWFTFARSSWIGLSGMIFVGLLLASRPTRILGLVGGAFLLVLLATHDFSLSAVIASVESLGGVQNVTRTAGLADSSQSLQWRYENWYAAIAMWSQNPIFGVGLDLSPAFMIENMALGSTAHNYIPPAVPHNMFLMVLAESGIVAFLLFIGIWILAFRALWIAQKDPVLRPYAIGIFCMMLGQIGTFWFNPMPREIWISLALSAVLRQISVMRRVAAKSGSASKKAPPALKLQPQ